LERDPVKAAAIGRELPDVPVTVGDATTRAANDAAAGARGEAFGGPGKMLNCVCVFDYYRRIEDLDPDALDDAFDEIFRVNVKSHLRSVKAALPELKRSGRGVVQLPAPASSY